MALVLTRRRGEDVILTLEPDVTEDELQQLITQGITIRITDLNDSQVRVSIQAPSVVSILRGELQRH